jgi:hypothetical protein
VGVAHLIVMTTALGYLSMTLKELAKGRNPREPKDGSDYVKLFTAAAAQGGGAGLWGDFLFGQANRFGGGWVESMAGPTAGTIGDLQRLLADIRDGGTRKTRGQIAAAEGLQFLKNHAPFVNLFYTRMALDYFVFYRLQELLNPGYLHRYEQKVKRENAQTFWLRPSAAAH